MIQKGKDTGLEIIKLLRQFGVLKTVKNNISKDLSEINDEDVVIVDVTDDSVECKFVFSYVGLIVVKEEEMQISMFMPFMENPVVDKLKALNLMEVTPSQAIRILEELKESIDD